MDRTIDMLLRNLRSEITRLDKEKKIAEGESAELRLQLNEVYRAMHDLEVEKELKSRQLQGELP